MATESKPESLNIHQRMMIARREMGYIQKKQQGGLPFATVNHDEVTVAARIALDKANVLAIPNVLSHEKTGNTTTVTLSITFVNPDNPEERYDVVAFAENNNGQDKGPGGAMSYGWKYCYLKALMAETGEKDADQQNVDTKPEQPKPEPGLPVASHKEMVERMMDFWGGQGVSQGEVLDYLEVQDRATISEVHLDEMIKLARAVRSGSMSAAEALKPPGSTEDPAEGGA